MPQLTSKQKAERLVARWERSNASPDAQTRLLADRWRLWRLARDLAAALDGVLGHIPEPGTRTTSRRKGTA